MLQITANQSRVVLDVGTLLVNMTGNLQEIISDIMEAFGNKVGDNTLIEIITSQIPAANGTIEQETILLCTKDQCEFDIGGIGAKEAHYVPLTKDNSSVVYKCNNETFGTVTKDSVYWRAQPVVNAVAGNRHTHVCKGIAYRVSIGSAAMEATGLVLGAETMNYNYSSMHNVNFTACLTCLGWAPSSITNYQNEWLEVDLINAENVVGVQTKGMVHSAAYPEYTWVTEYYIQVLSNGGWQNVSTQNGGPVFTGNTDRDTMVTRHFADHVVTSKVRLIVKSWHGEGANGHPVVRMGVLVSSMSALEAAEVAADGSTTVNTISIQMY